MMRHPRQWLALPRPQIYCSSSIQMSKVRGGSADAKKWCLSLSQLSPSSDTRVTFVKLVDTFFPLIVTRSLRRRGRREKSRPYLHPSFPDVPSLALGEFAILARVIFVRSFLRAVRLGFRPFDRTATKTVPYSN